LFDTLRIHVGMKTLLTPPEVDRIFRLPFGRSERLAKKNKLPHLLLPGGEIRFEQAEIEKVLNDSVRTPERRVCVA
jgi:hypothetical protein